MAPFLYQESYGGTQVRGNENLDNGYNYNIDLRYEFFRPSSTDMVAVTPTTSIWIVLSSVRRLRPVVP